MTTTHASRGRSAHAGAPRPDDGTLVTAADDGSAYVVLGGKLQRVVNPADLAGEGIVVPLAHRVTLDRSAIEGIGLAGAPEAESLVGTKVVDSGLVNLGANHHMRTWGSITDQGAVAMQTRTMTGTWFGGYHGGAKIITCDASGAPTWQSNLHRFGVDGTWIGTSDRTDAWWEQMTPAQAAQTTQVAIANVWSPDSFMVILGKWVAAGKKIEELITEVASVGKIVKVLL